MNNKLIIMFSVLFFSNVISMESNRKTSVLPLEFEYFDKLSKSKQHEILLRLLEGIVDKKYSVDTNLKKLLERVHDLFLDAKNPYFKKALSKNRELLFKKMGDELSKTFSLQDLNNALLSPDLIKDSVIVLLFSGADANYDDGYATPLLVAARELNLSVMEFLIEKKANVNAIISKGQYIGQTPLIAVILSKSYSGRGRGMAGLGYSKYIDFGDRIDAVEMLLKSGAKVDIEDANGKTALDYAKEKSKEVGFKDIEKILVKAEEKMASIVKK